MNDFTAVTAEYSRMANALADRLTDTHWDSGTSRHYGSGDEPTNRRRLAMCPVTDSPAVWQESQAMRSQVSVDADAYVPFLFEHFDSSGTVTFRFDQEPAHVTVEQVLLSALVYRLRPLAKNWAYHQVPDADWARDAQELQALEQQELSRLLGTVNPAWHEPLGRLSLVDATDFDDVESFDQLIASWDGLVGRLRSTVQGHRQFDEQTFERAFAHHFTNQPDALNAGGPGRLNLTLIEEFDRHRWVFPATWIDRDAPFGQDMSADQLLRAGLVGRATRWASEFELDADELVAAMNPRWLTSKSQKRRLPLS